MNATIRIRTFLVAWLVAFAVSGALGGSGGSTYSLLGLGDIRYVPGTRAAGMGYTGIGLVTSQYINGASPGSWTGIDRIRLEAAALYEGFNSTDGTTTRYLARMDTHGALIAIPVSRQDGIVIVGGFVPYSLKNYDLYTQGSAPGSSDTLNYQLHHAGSGGMTKAQLGVSWAPFTTLSLGASFNYLFGTLSGELVQESLTPGMVGGTVDNRLTTSGVGFTGGLIYSGFGAFAEGLRPLSLGITLTTRTNVHTKQKIVYQYSSETDTSEETYGRIAIPYSLGVGLAYQATERWVVAADYVFQPWSKADVNGSSPSGLRNSYRLGIGAERGGSKDMNASWLDRIAFRFGFSYDATYYNPENNPINDWGVTAGLGIPLSGESRFNVAASYGGRGTTNDDLIKDKIFRVTISLNLSDLWFVRPEED